MVNIQAIIYLSNNGTKSFDSFAEYWAFVIRTSQQTHRNKITKYKQLMVACAMAMSEKYNYTITETENIVMAFGSILDTHEGMKNSANRDLLCNLENRVVIEIKETAIGTHVVSTIHRSTGFERIATICKQTVLATPRFEP